MDFEETYRKYLEYSEKLRIKRYLFKNNLNDYRYLENALNEIYKFLKLCACEFYNPSTGRIDRFYKIMVEQVKLIERTLVPKNYFIIPSNPIYTFKNNVPLKPKTDDADLILDWLVYMARSSYARQSFWSRSDKNIDNLTFENECEDMSKIILKICQENGIECKIKRINPGFEDTARLYDGIKYHDVCVVTLSKKEYLVDCTYRQFFMLKGNSFDRIGVPYLSNACPGIFMTLNNSRMEVANRVLTRGWIPLKDEYAKNYFDGFALSFRNGIYYEETGDYSYTTNYSALDYANFLNGLDNQVNHEGEKVLRMQTVPTSFNIEK